MKKWKSKTTHKKENVFSSEIRLSKCDTKRQEKVDRLLKMLNKESFDAVIS